MDQSGGLERLSWFLLSQFLGGKLPQLIVDQRQELLGRARVALLDLIQNPRYFAHAGNRTARRGASTTNHAEQAVPCAAHDRRSHRRSWLVASSS